MRRVHYLAVSMCFVALLAMGCSGISYNYDFDPQLDFNSFQTYGWVQPQEGQSGGRGVGDLVEKRITAAVEQQLDSKGYRKTSGKPDFLVNFYVTTQEKIDVNTYHSGWGYYGWYGGGTTTTVNQWTEGTLVIDLIDLAEEDLAWRGWATAAIEPNRSPEERTRMINEVVAGIFSKFPPS